MATAPTFEEIKRSILDAFSTHNARADEIVPWLGIQMKLPRHFRAPEIKAARDKMIADGLVTYDGGRFIKLTDAGYAEM